MTFLGESLLISTLRFAWAIVFVSLCQPKPCQSSNRSRRQHIDAHLPPQNTFFRPDHWQFMASSRNLQIKHPSVASAELCE
jgi:hypothetical protein